jgi:hypothetical protein
MNKTTQQTKTKQNNNKPPIDKHHSTFKVGVGVQLAESK